MFLGAKSLTSTRERLYSVADFASPVQGRKSSRASKGSGTISAAGRSRNGDFLSQTKRAAVTPGGRAEEKAPERASGPGR